jgi:hypothetical protein
MPLHQPPCPRWSWAAVSLVVGLLTFALRPALSQELANRVVTGVVYDSVTGKPLAGATVELAAAESPAAPRTATTNTAGAYRFEGVATGRYVLGFYHDALTTLGLDAPMRTVNVGADATVVADLAVPSSETIRALRCGESPAFAPGMLVGFVRDAESHGSVPGARVVVHWRAIALDSGDYRVVTERRTGTVESDGSLLVCHLPVDAPLDLLVTAPGHHQLAGTVVNVPTLGIGRLGLTLVDSAETRGSAMIRGAVSRESGRSVASGRVVVAALGRDVPIENGRFVAAGLPAGTWVAEARVIGVEPRSVLVTAADSAVSPTMITVDNGVQLLEAVSVIGKPDRQLRVLDEVLRRQRVGTGTTFLPGHPAIRNALFMSDILKEARGFRVVGKGRVFGRQHGNGRCAAIATYVDGVSVPGGFEDIDGLVARHEVLAVEAWPDIAFAPVIFRYGLSVADDSQRRPIQRRPCAVVAIWTHRRF